MLQGLRHKCLLHSWAVNLLLFKIVHFLQCAALQNTGSNVLLSIYYGDNQNSLKFKVLIMIKNEWKLVILVSQYNTLYRD